MAPAGWEKQADARGFDWLIGQYVDVFYLLVAFVVIALVLLWPIVLGRILPHLGRPRLVIDLALLAAFSAGTIAYYATLPGDYAHELGWRTFTHGEQGTESAMAASGLAEHVKGTYAGPDRDGELGWVVHGHLKVLARLDVNLYQRFVGNTGPVLPKQGPNGTTDDGLIQTVIEMFCFVLAIPALIIHILLWVVLWTPALKLLTWFTPMTLGALACVIDLVRSRADADST